MCSSDLFAQQMSPSQLAQRMKGSAVAVNTPGGPAAARQAKASDSGASPSTGATANRPGATDPFKAMAKDLNG